MKLNWIIILIFEIFVSGTGAAQERNWKIHKLKDDGVLVKSQVVDGENERGEEIKIMHYVAEKEGELTLAQAEQYLRNSDNYKEIWESTAESREIRKISKNEWETYFVFDAIWPMPKSDCIQRIQYIKTGEDGFKIVANAIDDKTYKTDYERVTIYDVVYNFRKINSSEIKLTLSVSSSPVINPPKFLMRAWFPKGPAGVVNRFFENASKEPL